MPCGSRCFCRCISQLCPPAELHWTESLAVHSRHGVAQAVLQGVDIDLRCRGGANLLHLWQQAAQGECQPGVDWESGPPSTGISQSIVGCFRPASWKCAIILPPASGCTITDPSPARAQLQVCCQSGTGG